MYSEVFLIENQSLTNSLLSIYFFKPNKTSFKLAIYICFGEHALELF